MSECVTSCSDSIEWCVLLVLRGLLCILEGLFVTGFVHGQEVTMFWRSRRSSLLSDCSPSRPPRSRKIESYEMQLARVQHVTKVGWLEGTNQSKSTPQN